MHRLPASATRTFVTPEDGDAGHPVQLARVAAFLAPGIAQFALGVEHLDLGLLADVDVAVAVERDAGRGTGESPFPQELALRAPDLHAVRPGRVEVVLRVQRDAMEDPHAAVNRLDQVVLLTVSAERSTPRPLLAAPVPRLREGSLAESRAALGALFSTGAGGCCLPQPAKSSAAAHKPPGRSEDTNYTRNPNGSNKKPLQGIREIRFLRAIRVTGGGSCRPPGQFNADHRRQVAQDQAARGDGDRTPGVVAVQQLRGGEFPVAGRAAPRDQMQRAVLVAQREQQAVRQDERPEAETPRRAAPETVAVEVEAGQFVRAA